MLGKAKLQSPVALVCIAAIKTPAAMLTWELTLRYYPNLLAHSVSQCFSFLNSCKVQSQFRQNSSAQRALYVVWKHKQCLLYNIPDTNAGLLILRQQTWFSLKIA